MQLICNCMVASICENIKICLVRMSQKEILTIKNDLKCVYLTRENYGVFYHDWGNYGREKYGGISPKPPIFPGHNFTCDFCFAKFFKIIYSFLSVPDAFSITMIIISEDYFFILNFYSTVFRQSILLLHSLCNLACIAQINS